MVEIPKIETMRLWLRPFTPADNALMHQLMNGKDVMRYFPGTQSPTLEQIERMLAGQAQHWQEHGYGWWAVELKATQMLIGWCGLQYLPETDETEVGYLLGRDYWGRGLATEAAQTSVEWGFAHLPIDTIIAITHTENTASQHVAEKCGLTFARADEYFGMDCFVYTRCRQ
jgi:ribosomal-protein-alanine N-acetyltransferase